MSCHTAVGVLLVWIVAAASAADGTATPPVFRPATTVVPYAADDVGGASEMESGDLNGDGLADVVVARITYPPAHITHPIGIFLADGHGGFVDGSSMWDGLPARTEWGRQIVIADFNGDHRNDIFVADHGYDAPPFPGHANALALSTPQGKLIDASNNLPAESGFSHSAAAADVNRDGSIDLYVGNLCCGDGTPPEILLNDGTGHFTRRTDLLPPELQDTNGGHHRYTRDLFVDANGDGAPDLVLGADNQTPDSQVLLNDGTGHFHFASAPLPPKPFGPSSILISLASLDINADGRPDLLAGFQHEDFSGRAIQVLINNGDGTFRDETATRLPAQDSGEGWPYAFRVADFNGDGHLDFTVDVNHYPVEHAPLYLDDGKGVYREVPFAAAAQLFSVVDANGDGHPDIFSTTAGGGGGPEQHFVQLEVIRPDAPEGVRAVARHGTIRVTWARVPGAASYEVWRSTGRAQRRLVARTETARYDDRHVRRGTAYAYSVRAQNDAGPGPFSAAVRVRLP